MIPEGYITPLQFRSEILTYNDPIEAFEKYVFKINNNKYIFDTYYPLQQSIHFHLHLISQRPTVGGSDLTLPISSILTGLDIGTITIIDVV